MDDFVEWFRGQRKSHVELVRECSLSVPMKMLASGA